MRTARAREQEVAASFVVHDGLRARVVVRGIAGLVAVEVRIEVLEQAHVALATSLVLDSHLFEVQVAVEVHGVAAMERYTEPTVPQMRVAYQRFMFVVDGALPARLVDPGELAVDPEAEAARFADGVVLETDVGIEDVPQLVG